MNLSFFKKPMPPSPTAQTPGVIPPVTAHTAPSALPQVTAHAAHSALQPHTASPSAIPPQTAPSVHYTSYIPKSGVSPMGKTQTPTTGQHVVQRPRVPITGQQMPQKPTSTSTVQQSAQKLAHGFVSVRDLIAPSLVEVDFDNIRVNNMYYRTLFVAGYPRYVTSNWLHPVLSFDHSQFISMYIYPSESRVILEDLKRKIAEMEATIQVDMKRGKAADPSVQVALDDALSLQAQLAKGAERFFQFALYLTMPTESIEEVNRISKEVESSLGSILLIPKHATLAQEEGFKSTLPLGIDKLDVQRNMDTTSLASTFPFTTASLTANEGILYGINEHDGSLVIFDRFGLENSNSVIFGKSIARWENVLVRQNRQIRVVKIGDLVETLIKNHGITYKDQELEGVQHPNLEIFSYDKQLKGKWAPVHLAARKPFNRREKLYKVTTKSGRSITVTADHSLIVLRDGSIRTIRGQAIKIDDVIPLARVIPEAVDSPSKIVPIQLVKPWPSHLPQQLPIDKPLLTLLGFITSEGFLNTRVSYISNTDSEVLSIIACAAKDIGSTPTPQRRNRGGISGYDIRPNWYAKLFNALGAGGKAGEKRVPPLIFSLKNIHIATYLRSYFEGDGNVSKLEVTCCSKSKELISDIAYLLLRFGIIGRIREKFKRATNSSHKGDTYYELVISGACYIESFARNIGFLTQRKQTKLAALLGKHANTNVDTIPTLTPLLQKLYAMLYQGDGVRLPANFSPLKRGVFSPSPAQLHSIITAIENRIRKLRKLRANILFLNRLPDLETLRTRGRKNRRLNRALWNQLGASWQLLKMRRVIPKTITVLRAFKTITGETIALPEIKHVLYETFQEMGVSLQQYNKSLWATIKLETRRQGDTSYPTLFEATRMLKNRYRSLQLTIRHAQKIIAQLRKLADADLFWDPIVKIEKIKHKEQYVYDLTVENEVFLAGNGGMFVHNSGSGKSFLVKLEVMRQLIFDSEVFVIDPEGEYIELTRTLGGELIDFSFNSPVKINPFDLSGIISEGENELGLKILSLHGLMRVIMGEVTPAEDAILDRALVLTFKQKGITPDPSTQKNEPPLMEDLYKVLLGMEEEGARHLAERLEKFVKGSLSGIFNQKSNLNLRNQLTVFNIKELEAELRPVAMFVILDFIWTKIKRSLKKRILVVDEAWYLMKHPDSATFLYGMAKRARKYYLGVTTITQDVEDFLSTDHGRAIITNSSLQILLKQSPAAIDKLTEVFYLSGGEKHYLLSAGVGEGLFFAGASHAAIQIIASPQEYQLATSKPQEIIHEQELPPQHGLVTPHGPHNVAAGV